MLNKIAALFALSFGGLLLAVTPATASDSYPGGSAGVGFPPISDLSPVALPERARTDVATSPYVETRPVPIYDGMGNVIFVLPDGNPDGVPRDVLQRSQESLKGPSYLYQGAVDSPTLREPKPQVSLFGGCTPVSGADNPHKSGTYVSAHGWWEKGTCTKPKATVTTCLYEAYGDSNGNFVGWYLQDCTPRDIEPGTSRRANVRVNCPSTTRTGFLNIVDVDVIGQNDTSETASRDSNVNCRIE